MQFERKEEKKINPNPIAKSEPPPSMLSEGHIHLLETEYTFFFFSFTSSQGGEI